jgi:hypothetical protein
MQTLRLITTTITVAALALASSSFAAEYSPIASLGMMTHSGKPAVSIAGAKSYSVALSSEKSKGVFRPKSIAELQYGKGDYKSDSSEFPFTLMGADFMFGFNIFVFKEGQLQPYFGAAGSLGARSMALTVPDDSALTAQSMGLAFGYEVAAGCDIRLGSSEGSAFRVEGTYSSKSSSLAGTSLRLDGFRFSLGKSF